MTPQRLAAILSDLEPLLGKSQRRLADLFGYASENNVRQWLSGRAQVPPHVAAWLEKLHRWWGANRPG